MGERWMKRKITEKQREEERREGKWKGGKEETLKGKENERK